MKQIIFFVHRSDPAVVGMIAEVSKIRQGLTVVQHYDTISVPLVYTQVKYRLIINETISITDFLLEGIMNKLQMCFKKDNNNKPILFKK